MGPLTSPSVIREVMERHGVTFTKALGQNFLINPSVCPRMARLGGAGPGVGVLEIGPGAGVLTAQLAQMADRVVAVELDGRLLPVLAETLAEYENIKVIHGDALKLDLGRLLREEFGAMPVVVCANLPYYITSPLVMALLEQRLPVESITVMVQKEAAQRICAGPGTRQASALGVAVAYYSAPKLLFSVSRGSFLPAPEVDSAVIRLDIRKTPPVEAADEARFFAVVRGAFQQRRKTVLNSLSAALDIPKEALGPVLAAAGVPQNAEALSLEDFAAIAGGLGSPGA